MMRAESVDNRFVSYFQRLEKDVQRERGCSEAATRLKVICEYMEEAAAGERLKSEGHQGKILYDRTNGCWYAAKFLAEKSHRNLKNYYFFRKCANTFL